MAAAEAELPDEVVVLVQDDPRSPGLGHGPQPRLELRGRPRGLAHVVALQAGREERLHRGELARVPGLGGDDDDLHGSRRAA